MMKFLRSQSQLVLVIVLGFIGLGFLFYGSSGNMLTTGHISNDYGRIDGSDLSVADLYSAVHNTRYFAIMTGQGQQLAQPGAQAAVAQEAWRRLLLLHEADRLHIQISDQELADYIRSLPPFQKDGVYSPEAYQDFMGKLQAAFRLAPDAGADPLGSTKATFETLMRENLRIGAVKSALFDTVRSSNLDVDSQYEKFYGPTSVSLITFDPKTFENSIQITPEEIDAEYKSHPMNPEYRTKEKRNVDYVLFLLSPDQAKLPAKDKAAAIDALGQKALDFALAFQPDPSANPTTPPPPPDFFTEAKKRGLTPVTTGFFTVDTPPTGLPPSPSFNNAAFELTKDSSISKVVELDNGVAVLHLSEIKASNLLPLDQVKETITAMIRETKALQAEQAAAQKAAIDLKAAVAKGTAFSAAAASLNLKVETLPAFVPMKVPQSDPRLQVVAYVSTTLTPGQVSDAAPIQGNNDMVIVGLDSRAKADPAGLADFAKRFSEQQNQQLRGMAYIDWANWASSRPGTRKPPGLEGYGGVE